MIEITFLGYMTICCLHCVHLSVGISCIEMKRAFGTTGTGKMHLANDMATV
jgi:hypothetical protein